MALAAKPIYSVQVRELVEFALRRGDLGRDGEFVGPSRALAGTRGHQRVQRSRPAGYEKEVAVSHDVEAEDIVLRIQGRIDGLVVKAGAVWIEEIKTVQGGWAGVADPLHWAQAKCYGFIYAQAHPAEMITLQLTYLDLDTGALTEFQEIVPLESLAAFFEEAATHYLEWVRDRHCWMLERDRSIRSLDFPFPRYRLGQRDLAVAAYRTLARGGRLFLEAPTGIGKTVSVLFPALKAMAEGRLKRIFYLTARTVGRMVAEKALAEMHPAGLRLRSLTLTAREKICFQEGKPCDPAVCPFAAGYYDRYKAVMKDALQEEVITRPVLEAAARRHQVCPFELSLDLSMWVDVIVCDYNYLFDPKAYLRRHFAEDRGDYGFLVDEAHNLVDRAREMFSADLDTGEIGQVRRALKQALPRCGRALSRLGLALRKLTGESGPGAEPDEAAEPVLELELFPTGKVAPDEPAGTSLSAEHGTVAFGVPPADAETFDSNGTVERSKPSRVQASLRTLPPGSAVFRELPAALEPLLETALREAEAWLAQNRPAPFREDLLELYFRLHSFLRTAQLYDERYVTLVEAGASVRVRLFCLDPAYLLRQALQRGRAAVFFSATLTPIDYYRALLGGSPEDPLLQLPSPFPPENLAVLVHHRIQTHFKARDQTLADVAQAIRALVQERRGNYLAYLPSYQYLNAVQQEFRALHPKVSVLVQRPSMTEAEREAFLAAFGTVHEETLVGFAVLGGVFGEGIDLVGDRLIGVIIVGVGLPQLCVERDLICDYFQDRTGVGFDYAYTFPGMNRVLQATGRVIRTETDRGVVLLIDTRFTQERYRRLFPTGWRALPVREAGDLQEIMRRFWSASETT